MAIMVLAAGFQERTGPTKELTGEFQAAGRTFSYRLTRSGDSTSDEEVVVPDPGGGVAGRLFFKRYPTNDPFTPVRMERVGENLVGLLPAQPAAGKLEYYVVFLTPEGEIRVPGDETVILRFKDPVPIVVLVPHIVLMFSALLLGVRTGLGALLHPPGIRRLAWITLGFMTVGGMILGPIVQKYAFGAFWTGWPFGYDLTDNKTLIMWLAWLGAVTVLRWRPKPRDRFGRASVVLAALVMMGVYLIPHSLRGSELDYGRLESARMGWSPYSPVWYRAATAPEGSRMTAYRDPGPIPFGPTRTSPPSSAHAERLSSRSSTTM
jgi:hypothetical protein